MNPAMLTFLMAALLAAPLPPVVEPQPDRDGRSAWHTRHFRIESDTPLSPARVARLSQVADNTLAAVQGHPLPLYAPPRETRPAIAVFGRPADYEAAGGERGSAGFYVARRASVLLLADFVAPDAATAKRFPPGYDEDIVVHELVHLGMHGVNVRLPQWFVEGIAEYFACAHEGGGRFRFDRMDAALRDHLRKRFDPRDPGLPLVAAGDLVSLSSRGWTGAIGRLPPEERYRAYATALLLVHYHLHGGRERLDRIRTALETPARRPAKLLDPADGPDLETKLARYWKPKGLDLRFETRLDPPEFPRRGP